jgi:hypothetical protein
MLFLSTVFDDFSRYISPGSWPPPTRRDRHPQCIAEKGRIGWQKASGYNKRSRVEADVGRYKRVIGDGRPSTRGRVRSCKDGRRTTEVVVAVWVLNRMLELGRPTSVRIT